MSRNNQRKSGSILKLLACTEAFSMDDDGATISHHQQRQQQQQHFEDQPHISNRRNSDGIHVDTRSKDSFIRRAVNSLLTEKIDDNIKIVSNFRRGKKKRTNLPTEATSSPAVVGCRSVVGQNLRKRLVVALLEDSGQFPSSSGDGDAVSQQTADAAASIKKLLRRLNDVIDDYRQSGSSSSGVESSNTSCSSCASNSGEAENNNDLPQSQAAATSTLNDFNPVPPPPPPPPLPPPPPPRRQGAAGQPNDATVNIGSLAPSNNRIIKQIVSEQSCSWSSAEEEADDAERQCSATVVAKPVATGPSHGQSGLMNCPTTNMIYAQTVSTSGDWKITKTTETQQHEHSMEALGKPKRIEIAGPSNGSHRRSRHHHRGFRRYRCAQPQAANNYYATQSSVQMPMTSSRCCRHCCCGCAHRLAP